MSLAPIPLFSTLAHPCRAVALDTSTDRMSLAVGLLSQPTTWRTHEGSAGAQASATLLPRLQQLLQGQGWTWADVDLIVFACGPGSFTGLRTTCAVVQGLAFAARPGGIPVLPLNTLWAVAEQARWQREQRGLACPSTVRAALDARMNELYVADWHWDPAGQTWQSAGDTLLCDPDTLALPASEGTLLAGNIGPLYGERLPQAWQAAPQEAAWPSASALLRLAPGAWAAGAVVEAAQAQPLYVRDKVAQTTAERLAAGGRR